MYAEKYQWIKGDKAGNVEQYSSHDSEWVYFIGGNRIKAEIMPEYMMQVDGNTPLDFSLPLQSKRSKHIVEENINETAPVINHKTEEFNPVKSLLKRASKQSLNCLYNFEIQVPKQSVYNLVQDSFDVEVDSIVLELVMADINKEELYRKIEEQIKQHILKFYNNGNNTNTFSESRESGSKEESSAVDEQPPAQNVS